MNWHPVLNQPLFKTDHFEKHFSEPDLFAFVACPPLTNSSGSSNSRKLFKGLQKEFTVHGFYLGGLSLKLFTNISGIIVICYSFLATRSTRCHFGNMGWWKIMAHCCFKYLCLTLGVIDVGDLYSSYAVFCFVVLLFVFLIWFTFSFAMFPILLTTFQFCIILHQFHFDSTPRMFFPFHVSAPMGPWHLYL